MDATQREVSRYGQIMGRSDIEIAGFGVITTKLYKHGEEEAKYYIEVWDNGCCVHFGEVID